jgi:hypothetical protein
VAGRIYENVPHLEDEIAYVWQARLLAEGKLSIPSPPHEKSFLVPFVVDYNGQRFGKYPPGWPLALAAGCDRGGARPGKSPPGGPGGLVDLPARQAGFGPPVGLLAAVLTLTSPFFLINSGSLLSHPLGLVLSAGFALLWLSAFGDLHAPGAGFIPWARPWCWVF